jgi:hypothetical protein
MDILIALGRWLVTNILLPSSRAHLIFAACLHVHLKPRLKALLIILVATAVAAFVNRLRGDVDGWTFRNVVLALAISVGAFGFVLFPLLTVMHTHNRRMWACWDLDNLLAKVTNRFRTSSDVTCRDGLTDAVIEGLIQDIKNSAGSLYILSPNGIYMYADIVREEIENLLPTTQEARQARKALALMSKYATMLKTAIIKHPGIVHFMLPDYRDPSVRASCKARRMALAVPPELDRAIGRQGRRILRRMVWRRRFEGRIARIVRLPHVCCARMLLAGDICYVQPFPINSFGVAEWIGIVKAEENPQEYAALRAVMAGLSHEG